MSSNKSIVLTIVVAAAVSTVAAKEAVAADVFTLKSATFEDGKMMPKKVANSAANTQNNPNCVGDNVSPEFSWSNVPEGTKSFVLLMTGSPTASPARLWALPKAKQATYRTDTSVGKALGAWASIPDHARHQIRCHTITRSFLSLTILSRRNCHLD
jgi:hypothetical protein